MSATAKRVMAPADIAERIGGVERDVATILESLRDQPQVVDRATYRGLGRVRHSLTQLRRHLMPTDVTSTPSTVTVHGAASLMPNAAADEAVLAGRAPREALADSNSISSQGASMQSTAAVAARVPNDDARALHHIAERRGVTVSAVVAQIVRDYVTRFETMTSPTDDTRGRAA